jgi:hypothetical protein
LSAHTLLSKLHRIGVEVRADGDVLRYGGPEKVITSELLNEMKINKTELLHMLTWDEDEAYTLLRKALAHLNAEYRKAGKPAYNAAALAESEHQIDAAFRAKDMISLRRVLHAYIVAGINEFHQHACK